MCKNKTFTIYEVRTQTYTVIYYVYEAITSDRQQSCTEEFFVFEQNNKSNRCIEDEDRFSKKKKKKKKTHSVVGQTPKKTSTLPEPSIYSKQRKQNMRATTVTQ